MNLELTELAFILDRSGSMQTLAPAAIAGFNEFLRAHQKAPGRAYLTVVLFDDEYLLYAESLPVREVVPLNAATYVPGNSTALLDSIGRTIDTIGQRLAATAEADRPSKVVVAILTDGLENASQRYTWEGVAERIRHQRDKYAWEFLFLGANQDAIATAAGLNIGARDAATFAADVIGASASAAALSRRTSAARAVRLGSSSPIELYAARACMEHLVQEEDRNRRGE